MYENTVYALREIDETDETVYAVVHLNPIDHRSYARYPHPDCPNIERRESKSPFIVYWSEVVPINGRTMSIPFFKGLLKKAFMPALKQSCFVDSWQSALSATTLGTGKPQGIRLDTKIAYLEVIFVLCACFQPSVCAYMLQSRHR